MPEYRHALVGMALVHTTPGELAVSHSGAAAFLGLPLLGRGHRHTHLTRLDGRPGRTRRTFTVHRWDALGELPLVERPPGHAPVVAPVIAAIGVAMSQGVTAGVVALDAGLREGAIQRPELEDLAQRMRRWPGIRSLVVAMALADSRAESPLESVARVQITGLGFCVTPQVQLTNADGEFVARVDLMLEELGVVVEVDGQGKYVDAAGHGSMSVVMREKLRESAITDLGYAVLRVDHAMLVRPEQLRSRLLQAAARSRRGPGWA